MRKLLLSIAIFVMVMCANAQTNQYFWYNGNLMMGNAILQIDSVTFGENESTDTLHILLPRTIIKEVHDTVYITIRDTVCPNEFPEGAINGEFSVSATKKVRFAKGNLQYQASTGTWRFAENQWDYVGNATLGNVFENNVKCNNALLSTTYSGWIDLFGYSTSKTYYGVSTSTRANDYSGDFIDWGANPISNGGNVANLWRTFSKEEWEYLCSSREQANQKLAKATINGVRGLIVLPDVWNCPSSLSFNANTSSWNANVYDISQWEAMENAGALFFPATGYRNGTTVSECQTDGHIWTNSVYHVWFNQTSMHLQTMDVYSGRTVRLVQDIE